jgi:hypothetical protein
MAVLCDEKYLIPDSLNHMAFESSVHVMKSAYEQLYEIWLKPGVHRFSKNLGATKKVQAPNGCPASWRKQHHTRLESARLQTWTRPGNRLD